MDGNLWQDQTDLARTEPGASPVTVPKVVGAREAGRKLVCLTAYDAPTASLADAGGADLVLVGDSLGTVIQGHPDTLPVTLDEMIYHARAVRRGLRRALMVVDLPFGTFQQGVEETMAAAVRVMKETGASAVKIEGGSRVLEVVRACTRQHIPVLGHLGLTPQSVHAFGGFRYQGKEDAEAGEIVEDARRLEEAGVFAIVLECVPGDLARRVREAVSVPTIGIGAGDECDGQILVIHDMLGLLPNTPGFVRRFRELGRAAVEGIAEYADAVRDGSFPG